MHKFAAGRPDLQDEEELRSFSEEIKEALDKPDSNAELYIPGKKLTYSMKCPATSW